MSPNREGYKVATLKPPIHSPPHSVAAVAATEEKENVC